MRARDTILIGGEQHFRQTGKSVTGVEYQAWKFGPAPIELMEEWDQMDVDLARVVHIAPEKIIGYTRETVRVNEGIEFDDDDFTPRQILIMKNLAEKYRDTYSPTIIDVTHEQNGAWDKVWHGGKGARQEIPYEYSISNDEPDREELLAIAAEQEMCRCAWRRVR
ncbi:MAG: Panacea domain-containing protein [Rhodoferax sp.]